MSNYNNNNNNNNIIISRSDKKNNSTTITYINIYTFFVSSFCFNNFIFLIIIC